MAAQEKLEHSDGSSALRHLQAPHLNGLFPGSAQQFKIPDWYSEQYAHDLNFGVDMFGAWLSGGRKLIDAWRDSVRSQQDILLSGMRQQIKTHAAFSEQSVSDAEANTALTARTRNEPKPRSARGNERSFR